jgi:predicted Zn finger-like uncharacterized protein
MFRVVPDQLRISDGWVRCGHCDEVFDANAHLRSLNAVAEAPAASPPVQESQTAPQDSYAATQLRPLKAESKPEYDWGPVLSVPPAEIAATLSFADATLALDSAVQTEMAPPAYSWQSDPLLEQSPQGTAAAEELADTVRMPLEPQSKPPAVDPAAWAKLRRRTRAQQATGHDADDAPLSEHAALSFMKPGAATADGSLWLGRKMLMAASTLLALVLALQVLQQQRDPIAARAPALRPLLEAGCKLLACQVSALREIESMAIDSSAFTSVRPGLYLLNATLKNSAMTELAMPALELTLTNAQDQTLLRRVLLPAEISPKATLAAGAELSTSLPIAVKSGAVPEKIAGYKLLAFYP